MMKKLSKLLVFLLTLVLIGSSPGISPIQAAAENAANETQKEKELETVSKTADTIVLKAEKNYEYARKVTDDKQNASWKWAEKKQYDAQKETVSFTGLKADTEYTFTRRTVGDTDEKYLKSTIIRTEKVPNNKNDTNTDTSTDTSNIGTDTLPPGDAKDNDSNITPTFDTQNNDSQTTPTDDSSNKDSYDTPSDNAQNNSTQTTDSITTPPKEAPPSTDEPDPETPPESPREAPAMPALQSCTDTTVLLTTQPNQEYALVQQEDSANWKWQSSGSFENLTPGTSYEFVTRFCKSETQEASPASEKLKVTTKFSAAKAPQAPELDSRTDTRIQVKPVKGQEFSFEQNGEHLSWNTSGTFENLTPGTEYRIVSRCTFDTSTAMPGNISTALTVKTKNSAAKVPQSPQAAEKGETFLVLQKQENVLYGISKDGKNWTWTENPRFENLKSGTAYQFAARQKFNADTDMESEISGSSVLKTYVAFNGYIDGITAGATYDRGTNLTATAVGTGMDNPNPSAGDSRWIPRNWNWDGKTNRTWSDAPYSVTFVLNKAGNYELTVGFDLEEYTENGWKAVGQSKSSAIEFKAVVPVYTITSSADKNGRISPEGSIEIQEGENAEFTFLPNKNYRVAKVLVDGKSVSVKNNKYTIKNVKADHTITVSFERTGKAAAPKTADNTHAGLYMALFAASCGILLLLAVIYTKRQK